MLTALVAYFITYQLNMADQVSIVLLVMLVMIGLFLVPARLISNKINKGPTYALGLFIASVAVMTAFFFPHQPTPVNLSGRRRCRYRVFNPMGLPSGLCCLMLWNTMKK